MHRGTLTQQLDSPWQPDGLASDPMAEGLPELLLGTENLVEILRSYAHHFASAEARRMPFDKLHDARPLHAAGLVRVLTGRGMLFRPGQGLELA